MNFSRPAAAIYISDDTPQVDALARTTHLAIGAHHDDLEIMAIDGILKCYMQSDQWFSGVVVTDGRDSPRAGLYENTSDDEMQAIRVLEQKRAAFLGDYSAQVFLAHPSSAVKDASNTDVIDEIKQLVMVTTPEIIYTHNLADKHPTHIGIVVKVIQALRELPAEFHPKQVYGCEVWRDMDWMLDEEKVVFNCSEQKNLQMSLLGVFDSQINGSKRYDLAAMGRRMANATFFASHNVDQTDGLVFGMDLTPLIADPELDILKYIRGYIDRFADDVSRLISDVTNAKVHG